MIDLDKVINVFFGNRLKLLREEKGISQKELGLKINVSDRVIGYYETNKRMPNNAKALEDIADFFNVSIDWLLGRTEIRSFSKDGSNTIYIDVEGLSQEDIFKIKEYALLLKNKKK